MTLLLVILSIALIGVIVLATLFITLFNKEYIKQKKRADWLEKLIEVGDDGVLSLNEYQKKAASTNLYRPGFEKTVCCSLGISSEAGEVAGKVDKCIRKNHNVDFTPEQKNDIALEIGDVLWFCAGLAEELGYTFKDIAQMNLDKLASRQQRDKINGSGDHR